ncbi:uncharacterized protein DUF4124 [Methylobacter tundripaludum]|uniref:Uncharacterized protein DUF4124 n=1 Tax=Methylobacter tundripaludum TaxID=173365 RepID=A0A2S6H829_9GAMM|nr:DUF4124 domain-containing protein [Methylobacter tundripaludum]PPK73635.1 uncharacterized protein DUF4124 [Methylobacter tundripaludum]
MQTRAFSVSFFLVCFLCLSSQSAFAKKMYRWVNENGETVFSDQVPPEHAQLRRESLNEKGRVVEVTEQAKTKEQQAIDDRLNALKKAQEKIIAQQAANDKVLLSTFRNLKDMESSLYAKMQSLDAQRNVAQANLKRVENQLETQQKKAAELERNGKKIPATLLDEIKQTEAQIQAAYAEINKQIEKKNRAKAEFEADIERYKFLTQGNTDPSNAPDLSVQAKAAAEIGLYACETDELCAKAWASAHEFIKAYATTPIDTDTDKLIMGRAPASDSDLSLSVSKIEDENKKQQLFLDIRCRESSLGTELCASQKVRELRSAFKPYIESMLDK